MGTNGGAAPRLLRIQEVADEVGVTPRSVRYYEEIGLLKPAARSEGDYRLYDESDVERLRFIKGLRDDAGFSLGEIAQLLEDEAARERGHAAYHATADPGARRRILEDRVYRFDRQIEILRAKIGRLEAMVADAGARRDRALGKIRALEETAESSAAEPGEPETALVAAARPGDGVPERTRRGAP